jgi:hypothetical protein
VRGHLKAAPAIDCGAKAKLTLGAVGAFLVMVGAFLGIAAPAALAATPTATIESAQARYTTAHVEGEFNPEGSEVFSYRYEYLSDAQYEENIANDADPFSNAAPGNSGGCCVTGSNGVPFETGLTGVAPATLYHVRLYVESSEGSAEDATTFETEAVAKPAVTIDPVDTFGSTTATFTGHVNPNAPKEEGETDPAEQEAFRASWHFECSPSCGTLSGTSIEADNHPHEVSAEATGLDPTIHYEVKLVAENAGGATTAVVAGQPAVLSASVSQLGETSARLQAEVDPRGAATTYHFEYVTLEQFEAGEFAEATSTPESEPLPDNNSVQSVFADVEGLEPDTAYRFRAVATNPVATASGPVGPFRTYAAGAEGTDSCPNAALRAQQHSGFLPDCRAYEMVSPPNKNGGDLKADSQRTRVATDGNATTFISATGFADARGVTSAADYMAIRSEAAAPGDNGWETHAISPPQEPLPYIGTTGGLDPLYVGDFSDDLSTGIFEAWSPLTADPTVANAENLYLRRDLRTPGAGSYQLLSHCPLCAEPGGEPLPLVHRGQQPVLTATSADFGHVLFESGERLVAGSTANPSITGEYNPNLYESDHGVVRLAGILPDSACGSPPCVAQSSVAGAGVGGGVPATHPAPHSISADGRKVFFTDLSTGTGHNDGHIYMRLDNGLPDAETVELTQSERAGSEGEAAIGTFQDASVDGSRVFFTSPALLTDDAHDGGGGQALLYMYDTTKPASDSHNLTLLSPAATPQSDLPTDVDGTLAVSEDGHVVYFASRAQLVPSATQGGYGPRIYAWNDRGGGNALDFVGGLHDLDARWNSVGPSFGPPPPIDRITPDGRHLLFVAKNGRELPARCSYGPCVNTTDRNGTYLNLYTYTLGDPFVRCVSCNPAGAPPTGSANDTIVEQKGGATSTTRLNHALSADGSRVFFHTAESLVARDTNGVADVYEWEAPGTHGCADARDWGCLHLISSGTSPEASYFMDASPDGSNAFFTTAQQLLGWDGDRNLDLYDAREGGGFPEPTPAAEPCGAASCQTEATSGISLSIQHLSGPGNPQRPCPAGRRPVRHHGHLRCRKHKHHKKHHRHHHRNHHRASADRRAAR